MTDTMAAMGHSSASLTLNVYAQAMRLGDTERESSRALAEGTAWATGEVRTSAGEAISQVP